MSHDESANDTKKYTGGCHCGAVRYEVELDLSKGLSRCNCSTCTKQGRAGAIAKPAAFHLLSGQDSLTEYQWGGKTQRFLFCKVCGIHSFGYGNLPQLGGEYVSLNVNCLDDVDPWLMDAIYWDGRHFNWQAGPRKSPWPIQA
jgi:hypothetical protein